MTQQIHILLICFFLIAGVSSCQAQTTELLTEEQQLRKEMDEWMRPYYREEKPAFDIWVTQMEDFELSVLRHPVYKRMDRFYQKHHEQYLHLRKADLARYKPAPKLLPGYEWISDFDSAYNDADLGMKQEFEVLQTVANFRVLRVTDTWFGTTALGRFIINYLVTQQGMKHEEVIRQFTYGVLPFANLIEGNEWQITFINRMYALRFNWNIENNKCADLKLWVYTGGQQPAGWLNNSFPMVNTDAQRLEGELNRFRWTLYDDLPDGAIADNTQWTESMQRKLMEFYDSHRKEYSRIRNEELAQYPQIDEVYAKVFRKNVPALKEDFLTMLDKKDNHFQISLSDVPYEIDGARILFHFYYLCMKYSGHVVYNNMAPWVGGRDVHAKKMTKDVWEIQAFFGQYTLRFKWNVATDEISDIIIRTSETDAPPEKMKDIMVKPAESKP